MTAHRSGDSRILEDLAFLVVAGGSIELKRSAGGLVLLASDSGGGLLVGAELSGKGANTARFSVALGVTVLADTDTVDTRWVTDLGELSANTIGHVILSDGGRSDAPVAGTEGLGASHKEGSTGHGHVLELGFLTRAAVGKDHASATVLVLLPETDVDGLLSLTEGHGAGEDTLLEGLLGHGTLCTLGGVCAKRNSGTLVILHHALCAVLVILHQDL